ncbi:formimidoylglutamase [Pontibacter diazotrophicus]|uniref:Formimidoylglutamase n=1 Tax=Pontibacter diazotrophicus TaxID=1400979 RepID=A0A3D8LG52_9BACT|nr:formimidoylglutamase [Pontibacter diazotrophicus]RDV16378.1 formimidoylglutamase [Pontibacter diazotrophicus]
MYKPASKQAWKGRTDAHDEELEYRWHQVIKFLDLSGEVPPVPDTKIAFVFLGFCCDEGVRRNQGRTGAVDGPASLRSAMASFAHHLPSKVMLYDAGDVLCTNQNLEEAQEQLGRKVAVLLQHGYRPLVLGGGHEIAFGHFLGLEQATVKQRLGILNFDAHFDLRSYARQSSSGTPFLQIADKLHEQGKEFVYNCIGIQQQGNTRILFHTAEKLQVQYTFAEQAQGHHTFPVLQEQLQVWLEQVEAVYLTIDLDVFSAAYAPGVSAVNVLGLQPGIVLQLLQQVAASGKLLSLDVAELNPAFDTDNRTAKLAAGLLYHAVSEWAKV